jgi:5'-nucleotidase
LTKLKEQPLILLTNDDGIGSPGLVAAVHAVHDLGELIVVAPSHQQSGLSRSFPLSEGTPHEQPLIVNGMVMRAVSYEAAPAQVVRRGILTVTQRQPDLLISGINYGENVGSGITISGTVGAAIEGASFDIPSLAVSVETTEEYHFSHSTDIDFSAAAHFARMFARLVLERGLPSGVDILKIDVPQDATPATPWRITRVSRHRYFVSTIGTDETNSYKQLVGYRREFDANTLERDSDIYAIAVDKVVSVTPLTIDLTAKVDLTKLGEFYRGGHK